MAFRSGDDASADDDLRSLSCRHPDDDVHVYATVRAMCTECLLSTAALPITQGSISSPLASPPLYRIQQSAIAPKEESTFDIFVDMLNKLKTKIGA